MDAPNSGSSRKVANRIYDPVFWCMVIAMVLAVASSVTLRAVMAGSSEFQNNRPPEDSVEGRLDHANSLPLPRLMHIPPANQNPIPTRSLTSALPK